MKIKTKLAVTFLPLTLVTLIVLGSLAYFNAKHTLTTQVLNNLQRIAALHARQIENLIEQNRERLILVASRTQLRLSLDKYLTNPQPELLHEITRILTDASIAIPDFHSLSIQNLDGKIIASTDPQLVGTLHKQADFFIKGQHSNRVDLLYRDSDGHLGIYLAGPLYLASKPIGVLVIDTDISNLLASTSDYRGLGETGETLLVRRHNNGDVQFLTPARFDADAALQRTVSHSGPANAYIKALQRDDSLLTDAIDYAGKRVIAVTRHLGYPDWGLVVEMRKSEAYAPIYSLRESLFILIGIFSLVVIAISLYLARSITQPIIQLTDVATRISAGDLSQRARHDADDEVGALAATFNRMTENLVEDINQRRQAEEKFAALLKSAPDAIVIIDPRGYVLLANFQAEQLFGYQRAELRGKHLESLLPERHRHCHAKLREIFNSASETRPQTKSVELNGLRKDGREFPIEVTLAPIETQDGQLIASAIRDVSERKEAEAKLIRQANFDALTDLPNRMLAVERLGHALDIAHRTHQMVVIMFIDIDRFKNVNDTLGHNVGDKLLMDIAARLTSDMRPTDTVARLGGDEFLLILPELKTLTSAELKAEKLLRSLSEPYQINERELFISASIGIAISPDDGDNPDVLLSNADAAMYHAKDAGRDTYRFFTAEMNAQLLKRLEVESQLRYAIANNEMSIYFQPQVDVKTGRVIGAEALLRWRNSNLGSVMPDEFIPLAEDTGLITQIGDWVLQQACHAAKTWQQYCHEPIRVSVNVSPVQFRAGDLVKTIAQALLASQLPAILLELEITERLLVEDNPNTSRILNDLKRLGVRLALDDFGRGYSSLSYLKRFPFNALKIDRTFVAGVRDNPEDASLCRAILAMADSLKLQVVGEGVETATQWKFLRSHGVDFLQGYFISQPQTIDAFGQYLQDSNGILPTNLIEHSARH